MQSINSQVGRIYIRAALTGPLHTGLEFESGELRLQIQSSPTRPWRASTITRETDMEGVPCIHMISPKLTGYQGFLVTRSDSECCMPLPSSNLLVVMIPILQTFSVVPLNASEVLAIRWKRCLRYNPIRNLALDSYYQAGRCYDK